ncbi:MAG TPA: AarF/ABC1/UbiB kinase family protein [Nevskiales bacterium]|nr:AarF/ABC1/UbiB kinase family protein [Nevskiales bacterium]
MPAKKPPARHRGRRLLWTGARTLGRSMLRVLPGVSKENQWRKIGEDWFATLGELKGAAMKLGQIASQYRDILPPALAEQLARLQRQAEPLPFSKMHPLLDAQWSKAQWQLVEHIEPTALASASIGQVHRAKLADGRAVVIKIRYPGVAEAVDADLENLGRLIRMAGKLPVDREGLKALMQEIRARFVEETDYTNERRNLEGFLRDPMEGFRFPEPVPELCTDGVLVLTEIQADDAEAARHYPQALRDRIGNRLTDWVVQQIFVTGRLHADPHPGNFGFTPEGEIVVYDFGCVKHLGPETQAGLRAVLSASVAKDWPALHAGLQRLGVVHMPYDSHPVIFGRIYAEHCEAILDPVMRRERFDLSDGSLLENGRIAAQRAIPHWPKFRVAAELAFVTRTLSGLYWLQRGLKARVALREKILALAG